MAVAIDVIGTEVFHASAVSPRTYTGLTTGGSLTNGAVAFIVCYDTHVTGSAATWDGVACTLIASTNSGGTFGRVEVWGLSPIGAHTGNKTFSVSWTGGTSAITMVAGVSFTGVNQTGGTTSFPGGTSNTGTSGSSGTFNPTVNLTVNVGDIGIAGFTTDQNTFTSVNGTQIFRDFGTNLNGAGNLGTGNGLTGFAGTCTASTVNNWAAAGFDILAAASASGTATAGGGPVESPVAFSRKTIFQTLAFVPVVTTPTLIWNAWTDWPDFATKARPVADILPWSFIEPPPQVFYPFDRWPDTATKAKPSADFPEPVLVQFTIPTIRVPQWPDFATKAKPVADFKPWTFIPPPAQVFFPYDRWQDIAWAAKRVAHNPEGGYGTYVTPSFIPTFTQWYQWPDFATKARPAADFVPWTFVPPPFQVFYPFDRWPDSATKAKPAADLSALFFQALVPSATTIADWPDFARAALRALNYDPLAFVQTVQAATTTYTQWTQWPDFLFRAKPLVDLKPWSFVPSPFQVFYPFDRWPDKAPRAPQAADFPFESLVVPLQPTAWTQWTQWADFATRAKPTAEFFPWRFIEPPPQVWFPPGNWDDFTRSKFVQVDTRPWIGPYVTTAPVITWNAWTDWPDFATRAKPVPEFFPWRFIEPAPQVWFPHDAWADFVWKKKEPLNYVPLGYVNTATIKTPWVTMTTWPDFAPIKGKPGLPPQLQQFLARYANVIPLPTVSATMFAIGVTSDGAMFAINVLTSPTAATAKVSIQEIGGLSPTSIHEV